MKWPATKSCLISTTWKEGDADWHLTIYADETGRPQRCKLSSKIDSDTYLFVNRLGFKVLETRKRLALDLQNGKARVINTQPFFDRMMTMIVNRLKCQERCLTRPSLTRAMNNTIKTAVDLPTQQVNTPDLGAFAELNTALTDWPHNTWKTPLTHLAFFSRRGLSPGAYPTLWVTRTSRLASEHRPMATRRSKPLVI